MTRVEDVKKSDEKGGVGENKYTKEDASKDTQSNVSEVSQAWHAAREDAARSGHLEERNVNKVSDSELGPELYAAIKSLGNEKEK